MDGLGSQRGLFDIPADVAYFNTAYNAPQLKESSQRLHAGVDSKAHPWERTADDFFRDAETIRGLASQLFGGDVDGYAIVPAASYGMSTAARALEPQLGVGDRILVIEEEFPSNFLPWHRSARESGAELAIVPTPTHGDWTRAVLDHIDRRVRVVAVPSCHWTNGAYVDLVAIGAACRAVGAALAVDATQSLGAMPLAIEAVQPDFLVAAGYKWMLCPYGFGLLYVGERWRDARALEEGWMARDNATDFAALASYSHTYRPGARRFDVGEVCAPTLLPGAIAALEQLQRWRVPAIAEALAAINARIAGRLGALGFSLPEPAQRCPHMFGARVSGEAAGTIVARLREERIFVSQRGPALRFSPHLHVNEHDIDRLLVALERSIG